MKCNHQFVVIQCRMKLWLNIYEDPRHTAFVGSSNSWKSLELEHAWYDGVERRTLVLFPCLVCIRNVIVIFCLIPSMTDIKV